MKKLRRWLPSAETVQGNRWLRWLGPALHHPRLWHMSRPGLALGIFFGLLVPLAQIPLRAAAEVVLRVNVPAAVASTLVTNPLTFGPLNEFSANPARFTEAARQHYAKLYAAPGAMRAGFSQFAAFVQDAVDNRAFLAQRKLEMPILALGGEKSFGTMMAEVMRAGATQVTPGVVPDSGH